MGAPAPRRWSWVQLPAAVVKAAPHCVGCGCPLTGPGWATVLNHGRMPLFGVQVEGGQFYRYLVCSMGCAAAVEVRIAIDGHQVDPN